MIYGLKGFGTRLCQECLICVRHGWRRAAIVRGWSVPATRQRATQRLTWLTVSEDEQL